MARQARPWRREDRGGDWFAWVKGKQVWLAPADATKTAAQAVLTGLQAGAAKDERRPESGYTVRDLVNLFLEHCKASVGREEMQRITWEGYFRYLEPAREKLGKIAIEALKPGDVQAWLDGHEGWGPTTRYNALTALKRAFNWAVDHEDIKRSPLERMKRPTPSRRTAVMSPDQIDRLMSEVREGDPFRDFLLALRETGCRPGELQSLTADRIDLASGVWRVTNKTRWATGEPVRTVYLSPRALAISHRLAKLHPTGPVFRNTRGRAWTRNAVALRMGRLGDKLGFGSEAVAYSFRHAFATDALMRGVDPATVAELMGHKSLTMVMRVYNQLKHRTDHLREAVRTARRDGESADQS